MTTSEQYLLGCCLLDEGVSLDLCISGGLTSADFTEHGGLFNHLREMRESGTPIGLDTLLPRLNGEANVVELMALADPAKVGTTAHIRHHLRQALDDSARRRLVRQARSIAERAEAGEALEELSLAPPVQTPARTEQLTALASRRVQTQTKPAEPVTRLFLAGKPIATSGNLVTIISKAKTGKTAALGGAVAAIIGAAAHRTELDTLSFTAPDPKGHAVVVIDTEQSPYDAYLCYERTLKRADEPEDPKWLCHYALVGYSVPQLKAALELALATSAKSHGGVFEVILDGVADLVNSVNDEAECNSLVAWLRSLAVLYDCPIICVIHSNEAVKAGDDGRGHLGKQLTRKAESNLLLKKTGEVTIITSEKQRKAPITEEDGVAFKWSDQEQRHVSCPGPSDQKLEAKRDRASEMAEAVFEHLGRPACRYAELVKAIGEVRKIGSSASEDRFSDMKKLGVITKDIVGNWSLTP